MHVWLRRVAIVLAALSALAGAAFITLVELGEHKLHRHVDVVVAPFASLDDAAAIERGRYLFGSRGCGDCHGRDGRGKVVLDNGSMHVHAPDITMAARSVASRYSAADWVRTIRHGVNPQGRPIMVMPSEEYSALSDRDIAAIVSYVRQLEPGDGTPAEVRLPMLVKALYAAGVVRDASEKIDHSRPPTAPVAEGVTTQYGAYVARSCVGCHGTKLAGGKIAGAPPSWPAAARLAPGPGSALAHYQTVEQFMTMLKTGKRPDGSAIKVMPFNSLRQMNEVDVRALYLYLRALPESAKAG